MSGAKGQVIKMKDRFTLFLERWWRLYMKGIGKNRRRESIRELLKERGNITVSELAEVFNTSEVTIRNDLTEMEQAGLLRRVHGGAVSTKKSYYEMSLNDRMDINKEEKIRIAKACAGLIKDGDTLMIDSGTTTRYLARELSDRGNLTVVTNALLIAQEFVYNRSVNVILLGGNFDPQSQYAYGNDAITQLQNYRADKTIIATDGIGVDHGLTTYHHHELEVSRLMIQRSNKVIVVADHSKIGKEGFSNITGISSIDILITDKYASNKPELDAITEQGILVQEV